MVKEKCPKVRHVIIMNEKQRQEGDLYFDDLLRRADRRLQLFTGSRQPVHHYVYFSVPREESKGVMLTHRNMAENATCLDMKLPERSVVLTVLPIHHAYCLSMDILKGFSLGPSSASMILFCEWPKILSCFSEYDPYGAFND